MALKELCNKNVTTIGPEASVEAAARLMREKHCGELVVAKSPGHRGPPLGVITDRDLVTKVLAEGASSAEVRVEDVMVKDPLVIKGSEGVLKATETMEQAGVRRLPVVDDDGNLAGIVSVDDLYELLATEFSNLSRISSRQILMERQEPRVR
jgi:CBS domain-containing protein